MASTPALPLVTVRCKAVLFDMDGILISSLGSVERSWTSWANMHGIDPAFAIQSAHGCRSIETIARLRPDLDAAAENAIIEKLEIDDTDGLEVLPGVRTLLAALPRRCWTVVTSATRPLAEIRLKAAGIPLPERFITADDVTEGKPNPAPYLAGAALLGYPPAECVVFEDAASGSKAGRAAGCTVIATTFSHTVESLAAAHYLISGLDSVAVELLADDEGLELSFTPLPR